MPRPSRLTPPPLSAYQFINFMLYDSRSFSDDVVIPYAYPAEKWTFDDEVFCEKHFHKASRIQPERMATLAAMTDTTFERLIGRFGYFINGVSVKTKNDLALAAISKDPDAGEGDWKPLIKKASLEQIQSYFLYHKTQEIGIDWRDVVGLYNDSEPDQQEAIYQYFSRCLNRSLEDLLEMTGPEPLPANLVPVLETKVIDGKPCTYDEFKAKFVEDSKMIFNFKVTGYARKNSGSDYPIATTMTLEEAVAHATRFAMNTVDNKPIQYMSIQYQGNSIASADINGTYCSIKGVFEPALPIKLLWNTDRTGTVISKERLERTLIATEKAMGVSWSKVRKLEDELGL